MSNSNHQFWWLASTVTVLALLRFPDLRADPDLWWHTKTGLEILSSGTIPYQDYFSYTAESARWINHEWLSDVAFAAMFNFAGGPGLSLGRILLLTSLSIVLFRLLWTRFPHPLFSVLMISLVLPYASGFINVRPHSFTSLFVLVFVMLFDLYWEGKRTVLIVIPVLMAFWVNLHGGFLFGLGILGFNLAWILWHYYHNNTFCSRSSLLFLLGIGLSTILVTFLTPYGLELYVYLTSELGGNHSLIVEWQHPNTTQIFLIVPWILAPPVCWLFARRAGSPVTAGLFLTTVFLTYQHVRFVHLMVFFSAIAIFEVLPYLHERFGTFTRKLPLLTRVAKSWSTVFLIAASMILIASYSVFQELQRKGFRLELPPDFYPVQAVEFLKRTSLGPNLALSYAWGGYAIWHLAPHYKVSVDGRNMTIYNDEYVDDYLRAGSNFSTIIEAFPPDVVLIESNGQTYQSMLKSEKWHEIYRDAIAAVFIPPTMSNLEELIAAAKRISSKEDRTTDYFFP